MKDHSTEYHNNYIIIIVVAIYQNYCQAATGIETIFKEQGWNLDKTALIDPNVAPGNMDYTKLLDWVRYISMHLVYSSIISRVACTMHMMMNTCRKVIIGS